jgi:hypothetical protein
VNFADKTVKQVVSQKIRWLLNQKMEVGNRWVYLVGMLLYPEVPALFFAFTQRLGSLAAWTPFLIAAGTRIAISATVESTYLGTLSVFARYCWTVPLWDLSQIYFFVHGFFKTRIRYGAREYQVVDRYYLREVPSNVHA